MQQETTNVLQSSERAFEKVRSNIGDRTTHLYSFLMTSLKAMKRGVSVLEDQFLKAMSEELKVDESEAYRMALFPFNLEVNNAFKSLFQW